MPPQRTCLACRRRSPARDLLRLAVRPDGGLLVERRSLAPGRGAWLCPSPACVARLERQPERLARALGRPVRGGLREAVIACLAEAAIQAIPRAARSGCLASGQRRVAAGLAARDLSAVVVACDASPRVARRCDLLAGDTPLVSVDLTTRALGHLIGKGPRSVLGVRSGAPSSALLAVLRYCASLGYHPGQHRTGARPEATRRHGTTRSRGQGPRCPLPPEVVPEGSPTSAENTLRREGSVCPRKRS